jgi:hypothetical protein
MGSDEKEAEKAIKALVDELKGTAVVETPEAKVIREAAEKVAKDANAGGGLTKADLDTAIAAAVAKAVGELPEANKIRIIPRDGAEAKKAVDASAPFAF